MKKRAILMIIFVLSASLTLTAWDKFSITPNYEQMTSAVFKFETKPIIQNLTENSVAILWSTSSEAFSWLEYRVDNSEWIEVLEQKNGLYNAVSSLHYSHISALPSNQKIEYRVKAKSILSFNWVPKYGKQISSKSFFFKTLQKESESYSFTLINDLHENERAYKAHAKISYKLNSQQLFINGDTLSKVPNYKYIIKAVFVYYPIYKGKSHKEE